MEWSKSVNRWLQSTSPDAATATLEQTAIFFFNDTATTEIYTLSLHDALPISRPPSAAGMRHDHRRAAGRRSLRQLDRKSTRLNSSHLVISYAVFCLKKKKIRRDISHRCSRLSRDDRRLCK